MAKPKSGTALEVVLTVRLPDELMARVNLFASDSGDIGKAAAVRELLERGLAADANPTRSAEVAHSRSKSSRSSGGGRNSRGDDSPEPVGARPSAPPGRRDVTPIPKKGK